MALTDANVRQAIADSMDGVGLSDLADKYTNLATAANTFAQNTITRVLMSRGLAYADVSSWDDYDEFNRDLAIWYALSQGGIGDEYDDKFLERFDRRKELKSVFVTISNAMPDWDGEAQIGTGDIADASPVIAADEEW